ncbi:MAG: IS200/IS605 family transposase [Terriglobia bacterium]
MATYTAIVYHIVFATKDRAPVLHADRRSDLFRYVSGIIRNRQGHLYRINGVEDHLHILSSLHPTVSLADFVKDIKTGSAQWIKQNGVYKGFSHWQEGYAAFTCSRRDLDALIEYIKGQEEHHRRTTFEEEYRKLLTSAGIELDERFLP